MTHPENLRPYSCADCACELPWNKWEGERLMAIRGQEYLLCAMCESEREKAKED